MANAWLTRHTQSDAGAAGVVGVKPIVKHSYLNSLIKKYRNTINEDDEIKADLSFPYGTLLLNREK